MSRRFAELLIECHSLEQVVDLVADNLHDATAFVATAAFWIGEIDKGEAELPPMPDFEAPEITASGHAVIWILDKVEILYPEGLTEVQDEQSAENA